MSGVRAVHALSTGRMRLRPQHVRRGPLPPALWLATSRRWTPWLPVHVFAVEHDDALVLVDTGQDVESVRDPAGYYPGGLAGRLHRRAAWFELGAEDTLPAALAHRGLALGSVSHVVLTHAHSDHVGGLRDVRRHAPGATVLAAAAELAAVARPGAEWAGFLPRHVDVPGLRWQEVTHRSPAGDHAPGPLGPVHDVLGDGSIVIVPTSGHTPGSQSVLVRPAAGTPLLLVGDAAFSDAGLRAGEVPGIGSARRLRVTSREILALADRLGAVVLPAHDPTTAARLATAARAGGWSP